MFARVLSVLALMLAAILVSAPGCGKGGDESKKGADSPKDQIAKKKQPTDSPDKKPSDDKSIKKEPPKADIAVTAEEFASEFKNDKVAMKKKYDGKLVQLTGLVKEVGQLSGNLSFIGLEPNNEFSAAIICYTKEKEPWKTVMPGQKTKVIGKIPDFIAGAMLVDAEILEKSGPTPAVVTAAELAKEYTADREALIKKFQGKQIILKGEVSSLQKGDFGKLFLILKADADEPKVFCAFNEYHPINITNVQPGNKVSVVGQFIDFYPDFSEKKQKAVGTEFGAVLEISR